MDRDVRERQRERETERERQREREKKGGGRKRRDDYNGIKCIEQSIKAEAVGRQTHRSISHAAIGLL